jgi:hypothetical protein
MLPDTNEKTKPNRMDKQLRLSIPECSQQRQVKTTLPNKKKNQACFNAETPIPNIRESVRQHLRKRLAIAGSYYAGLSAGGPTDGNVSSSFRGKTAQARLEVTMSKAELGSTHNDCLENVTHETTSTSRRVMELDRENDVQLDFKDRGEQVTEMSQEQCDILLQLFENHQDGNEMLAYMDFSFQPDVPAQQESLSPVTSASNMLERLLRRSDPSSPGSPLFSGLEESTESMLGLL